MLSPYFLPIEIMGRKFDRGMQLFEFQALREPEKTRFPLIEQYVRSKIEMVEIPTPQMLWQGKFWPDLYISNQLDAVPAGMSYEEFTATFIEPMCVKIGGIHLNQVEKGLHRALWLPLYWPETVLSRQSIPTKFHYPKEGYAGKLAEVIGTGRSDHPSKPPKTRRVLLAFVRAKPDVKFSVLFVLDKSPIYRVTDMDVCAGLDPEYHRLVVEFRGNSGILDELNRLRIAHSPQSLAFDLARITLPIRENVEAGYNFSNNMNAQLWQLLQKNTRT